LPGWGPAAGNPKEVPTDVFGGGEGTGGEGEILPKKKEKAALLGLGEGSISIPNLLFGKKTGKAIPRGEKTKKERFLVKEKRKKGGGKAGQTQY